MGVLAGRVLLATDGSAEAEHAARLAATISRGIGAELHVVHVRPAPNVFAAPESAIYAPDVVDDLREIAEREGRKTLDEGVKTVGEAGGEVAEAHLRLGRPDAQIVELAEELGALVILGSRGLGPLKRALLGSVSGSVVRHAPGSVLVVRGDGRSGDGLPGKILVALDGSEQADLAARAAAELSGATGSEVHVVAVLPTTAEMFGPHFYSAEIRESLLERARGDARSFLEQQSEKIEADGGSVATTHLRTGSPEAEIVALGEELGAGLIVTGSRGLGGVSRALMGSVSDSVARHASCPVLVVRRGHAAAQEPVARTGAEQEQGSDG